MWDILDLPEKYKINKKVTVAAFLKKANMSETEKRFVSENVSDIELKYDVLLKNKSEIILIDVSCKTSKYKEVARFIAQSMPYKCIILLRRKIICSISFFQTRINKISNCRSVVEKQILTYDFYSDNISKNLGELIDYIHDILLDPKNTAELAIEKCIETVKQYKSVIEEKDLLMNSPIVKIILEGVKLPPYSIETYCLCHKLYHNDYDYFDNCDAYNNSYYYDLDIDIKSLLCCVYYFYNKQCSTDKCNCSEDIENFETLIWLLKYARFCNDWIDEVYKVRLSDDFYYILGSYFTKQETNVDINYLDETIIKRIEKIIVEYDENCWENWEEEWDDWGEE